MLLFKEKINQYTSLIEDGLNKYYPEIAGEQQTISKACRYSLLGNGKRIRPVLCLAVGELLCVPFADLLPYACSIEMIHTFSLIHDDLPSMDNDDYRRGRLTCHKVFGEGVAVLAGDSLLNKAYETMLFDCINHPKDGKLQAALIISCSTGDLGMIGGQIIDIESEHKTIGYDLLKKMHSMKTGALIKAPIIAACHIGKANINEHEIFEEYANAIGLAFQIKDDILDVISNSDIMGKTVGKDSLVEKSTYVSIFRIDKAQELLISTTQNAFENLQKLQSVGYDTSFLASFTEYLLKRDK